MKQQIDYLKSQLDDSKKIQETLISALGKTKTDNFKGNEIVESNKNLSSALERVESRCMLLENKNKSLKKYQRQVKSCVSMQCCQCRKYIYTNLFESHINFCITKSEDMNNNTGIEIN